MAELAFCVPTGPNGVQELAVTETSADETSTSNNDTASASPVPMTKEVRSRKKTFRVPLTVGGPGFVLPAMTPEQLKVGCFESS